MINIISTSHVIRFQKINKLDDETLKHKKLIMGETFERNAIEPTSKDFVYDVKVDFEPEEGGKSNEWDTEDEIDERSQ
jgi:hypothetical protein